MSCAGIKFNATLKAVLTALAVGGILVTMGVSGWGWAAAAAESKKASDDLLLPEKGGKDDLLLDKSDLLGGDKKQPADKPQKPATAPETEKTRPGGDAGKMHENLFAESRYPSANTCATCHPKHYREWSVSQHAYAQLSPVYMAMQMTINSLTSTTNGDFCIRCHNQVGMNMVESLSVSNLDRHPTSREGITCVVCHRVNNSYGKISGRFALVEGDLYSSIFGPTGGKELSRVLEDTQTFRVSADRTKPGRGIHAKAEKFFQLTTSSFCGTCHDVTLLNGFRLEEAFTEFKQSPAAQKGVSCQDCHMGKVQGAASGYENGPAAMVGGQPTTPRKLTNHYFAGPDYPIIHPGIFPHNVEAARMRNLREWLQFDYKAGWGTDKFENNAPKDYKFPDAWRSVDDRYDARAILDEQFKRLAWASERRLEVLRNGFHLGDIKIVRTDPDALEFAIDVINPMEGHAVPTGFDAERLIFLEVTVLDDSGRIVYQSGDRDPNGDVRDAHSLYVHDGKLPLDWELFNLQSKFLVRLNRGGEREQVLAINTSASVLPFVRPEARATTIYGRPRGARKEKRTIEPLSRQTATYVVHGDRLNKSGKYRISVKLVSQMVPVNLLAAIQGVGFDYGMSPKQIADEVINGAQVLWERHATVDWKGASDRAAAK